MLMCTFFEGESDLTKCMFVHSFKCWQLWMVPNTNTVYMLLYRRSTRWKHLRVIELIPVAGSWMSWKEGIETPYSTGRDLFPLLIFVFFGYVFDSYAFCLQLVLIFTDIDPVLFVLALYMKYTVEVVLLRAYIVWLVIRWL